MPVTTGELPEFKTIKKSVSSPLGKHRRVDQQNVPHLRLSLNAQQTATTESVRGTLTFRKRFTLDATQTERAGKVLDPRGSLPSILSKYSRYQRKQEDAVAHQHVSRPLQSKDGIKTKDNNTTPIPLSGTVASEQNHVGAVSVTDRTRLQQENDHYREVTHKSQKYLRDLIGGKIPGYPATERKRRLREDEDATTGRVGYNYHPNKHQHHHNQRVQLDATAENNGHPHHRLRHRLSESRSLNSRHDQGHDQVDTGSGHLKEPEDDRSKQTINDLLQRTVNVLSKHDALKQTNNDFSKETVDSSSNQVIINSLKQTVNDQSKPVFDDPLKSSREYHAKPTIKDHFKLSTGDPLNIARSPSASFQVTQRNLGVRGTDRRQVQNEGKKTELDLLKGNSRRSGRGRQCYEVAATAPAAPERGYPLKPSRCGFYAFEDLTRGSPSHEAGREGVVQKYIRDNNLMPRDKENWIKQWLRTVSPSVRDEDLEGDPALPRP